MPENFSHYAKYIHCTCAYIHVRCCIQTYNTDMHTGDSAATGTAFLCGEKAQLGTLGVNDHVARTSCDLYEGNSVKSMLKHAMDKGTRLCDRFCHMYFI